MYDVLQSPWNVDKKAFRVSFTSWFCTFETRCPSKMEETMKEDF
jgi:hypothetical protein